MSDPRLRELCAECGFDSDLYNREDTVSSQRIVPAVLAAAAEGLTDSVLGTRPDERTWSIAEYADHVREVYFGNRFAIEAALAEPGIDLGAAPSPAFPAEPAAVEFASAVEGVRVEAEALRLVLAGLDADAWDVEVTSDDTKRTVGWHARHVLHDGLHHMADIGRIRHRLGHGAATERGSVVQLSRSGGGVPKTPVESVVIGPGGVEGDAQNDRKHHGRPVQAVCLWSADVIDSLVDEGHPVAPGYAGENVTIGGVDWASLRPGARLHVGSVPMLVSAHAIPCAKNSPWFLDGHFKRMLHDDHPGWSRLYAIPLGSAPVSVGDVVVVEPD